MNTQEIINTIKEHPTYKEILKDSFGGIMYNVANKEKYNEGKDELLKLWEQISHEDVDGILKGAINFLLHD